MGVCGEEPLNGVPQFEGSTLPGWVASCWCPFMKRADLWATMMLRASLVHVVTNSWLWMARMRGVCTAIAVAWIQKCTKMLSWYVGVFDSYSWVRQNAYQQDQWKVYALCQLCRDECHIFVTLVWHVIIICDKNSITARIQSMYSILLNEKHIKGP